MSEPDNDLPPDEFYTNEARYIRTLARLHGHLEGHREDMEDDDAVAWLEGLSVLIVRNNKLNERDVG